MNVYVNSEKDEDLPDFVQTMTIIRENRIDGIDLKKIVEQAMVTFNLTQKDEIQVDYWSD